jgi:hypothetical protein
MRCNVRPVWWKLRGTPRLYMRHVRLQYLQKSNAVPRRERAILSQISGAKIAFRSPISNTSASGTTEDAPPLGISGGQEKQVTVEENHVSKLKPRHGMGIGIGIHQEN